MKYFTDSAYERMMMQTPTKSAPAPIKDRPPKKNQKFRKLIIVHEKKEEKNGGV